MARICWAPARGRAHLVLSPRRHRPQPEGHAHGERRGLREPAQLDRPRSRPRPRDRRGDPCARDSDRCRVGEPALPHRPDGDPRLRRRRALQAAREAGPAPPGSPDRFAALRGLLSTMPASGTNAVIVGHAYPFYSLAGGQYLDEGQAAVVRPGGVGIQVLARVGLKEWRDWQRFRASRSKGRRLMTRRAAAVARSPVFGVPEDSGGRRARRRRQRWDL